MVLSVSLRYILDFGAIRIKDVDSFETDEHEHTTCFKEQFSAFKGISFYHTCSVGTIAYSERYNDRRNVVTLNKDV